MELLQADLDYFNHGRIENAVYWRRMGSKPDFTGATTLDVGCGLGVQCIDMALCGAAKVVGLDTETRLIEFARENAKRNFPQVAASVEFKDVDLKDYKELKFDYIIAKDSFEHIMDLAGMLREMKRCLKVGGRIYSGFGPLYNSAMGHHGRIRTWLPSPKFPWGHHFEKESKSIERLNKHRAAGGKIFAYTDGPIKSIYDLGLNKMSLADYRRVFRESGLKMVSFKVNQTTNLISKAISWLRVVPFLEEYFTHNIYCVMEKTSE